MNTSISDINDKIALFSECFDDGEEIARNFFAISDVKTVCKYENDRLVAMASLVPILADKTFGYYIYGVCVAKDFRGRGAFRYVMKEAEQIALEDGASFVCLIPADKDLEATYRRWGYDVEIYQRVEKKNGIKIALVSDEFRKFAKNGADITERMRGLLKTLNRDAFCPSNREFVFSDDMGDV